MISVKISASPAKLLPYSLNILCICFVIVIYSRYIIAKICRLVNIKFEGLSLKGGPLGKDSPLEPFRSFIYPLCTYKALSNLPCLIPAVET